MAENETPGETVVVSPGHSNTSNLLLKDSRADGLDVEVLIRKSARSTATAIVQRVDDGADVELVEKILYKIMRDHRLDLELEKSCTARERDRADALEHALHDDAATRIRHHCQVKEANLLVAGTIRMLRKEVSDLLDHVEIQETKISELQRELVLARVTK